MDRVVDRSRMPRYVARGVIGGLAGSGLMAMYAMVVSAVYKDVGFFTPLHHIGSAFASPEAMMRSMEAAAAGDAFTLVAGTAVVGLVVHMATGAVAGAAFGLLVWRFPLRRARIVPAGAVYGLAVLLGNALVGLPVVAAVFGGGDPIADMPSMAGWGTFLAEHLVYGVVLGAVVSTAVLRRVERAQGRPQVTVS